MHIAIIAEYNPFHSGHAYQIEQVRNTFGKEACITVILGGIFSQRGAPYIAPPYVRAEAAVACGADLVLELPFPFSCAPAGIFARAGVEIAVKIGANVLAFGSECGDLDALITKRRRLDSAEFREALAAAKDETVSKTRLYTRVYEEVYGEEAPKMPNDILAIEYLYRHQLNAIIVARAACNTAYGIAVVVYSTDCACHMCAVAIIIP